MSDEENSVRFVPKSMRRKIFSLKWVPFCNFQCESQDLEKYQAEKSAEKEHIYRISHAVGKNRSSMANRRNQKKKSKSVQISEVITQFDISDEDLEEPGYRFLCNFNSKKYLSCLMFLAVMIAAWGIFLSHIYYEKYVTGEQYRAYVVSHNNIRSVVQKAFSVTNMLRMRHDPDLENEVKAELTCGLNKTENQAINVLRSRTFKKWSEVIEIWSDQNNLNSSSFRKLVWATNSRVGCAIQFCIYQYDAVLYMCKYFYIPYKQFNDHQPFERGNFNAKCRNNFDLNTELCLNSCPYHDSSNYCLTLPKKLCDDESGLGRKQCQGTCLCPKNSIYFSVNETDDYVKAFNGIRDFFKNHEADYVDLNNFIKDSELEKKSTKITAECLGTAKDWYFTSKYLTRFLDEAHIWKKKIVTTLSSNDTKLSDFYEKIISKDYIKVGCSLGLCNRSFYYHCLFE